MLSTRKLLVLDVLWQGLEQDPGLVQPAVLVMPREELVRVAVSVEPVLSLRLHGVLWQSELADSFGGLGRLGLQRGVGLRW